MQPHYVLGTVLGVQGNGLVDTLPIMCDLEALKTTTTETVPVT